MSMTIKKETLYSEPIFFSRLGFGYDPPRYDKEGRQIIFSRNFDFLEKSHKDFVQAGVRIHSTILPTGWNGDNMFDYTLTDEILYRVMESDPNILYIPRVKLNAPVSWCKNHPTEVFVYENGPRTPEEIAALVDTPMHDWFGFDCNGYPVNGHQDFVDDRPNYGRIIGLQSFSSEQWIADASDALTRLMKHLAESKYADRIVGYHIAFGMCGETSIWGGWNFDTTTKRGDYGITNIRRFREFGLKKYGSEDALCQAWGYANVDAIEPPSVLLRDGLKSNTEDFFYSGKPICHDYYSFCAEIVTNACHSFCKIVKEFDSKLLTGVFYGYSYLASAAHTGHLAIDRVLDSPYIDFLAAPKGYYRNMAGDPGGEQGPSYSINLKKIWLDEIDNPTFLDRRPDSPVHTLEDSLTLLTREALKNISYDQGFWWMDLAEGWYDHPALMERIAELNRMVKAASQKKHESVAEILLVTDEKSVAHYTPSNDLARLLNFELHSETKLCGAPVDTLRFCDLLQTDVSKYKLIIFTNCFSISKKEREQLKSSLSPNALLVWNYAAGMVSDDCVSLTNTESLTGFKVKELVNTEASEQPNAFPLLEIIPSEEDEILSRYENGSVMAAKRGNTVLCAYPYMKAEDIRRLAERAGCFMYAPLYITVYADNRVLGLFPKFDVQFQLTLPNGTINGKKTLALDIKGKSELHFMYD